MVAISDLQAKYTLLVVMRDHAGENKSESKAILDYFTSMVVENYYATAFESHQDGLVEAGIKTVFTLARSGMARSRLGEKYFCAVTYGKDCQNVTYKERIKNTPWGLLYGEKKRGRIKVQTVWMQSMDASDDLNKERREKGKTAPRAVEAVSLGFAQDLNTSAYKVLNATSHPGHRANDDYQPTRF
jgi:hypothetical protein